MVHVIIFAVMTQALVARCFRFDAKFNRGIPLSSLVFGKKRNREIARAEVSGSSASSASPQSGLPPSLEFDVPERTVGKRAKAHIRTKDSGAASVARLTAEDAEPPQERTRVSTPDYAALRKQVEYYFSDENLRYDKFFHDRISAEADGWLDMVLILNCNKVRAMKATQEDVMAALNESKLEVKEGGGFIRRPRNAALPTLEPKPPRLQQRPSNPYHGGIITVFNNISVEESRQKVIDALKAALPPKASLWFVSEVDDKHRCFCATAPFDGDVDFFESLTLVVSGAKLKPELCQGHLLQVGLGLLPKDILELREKEVREHHLERKRPIVVGTALRRLEAVLRYQVGLAIQGVERLETSWPRGDIARRIVRYIYNSAKREELRSMHFEEACNELVKLAMVSYELAFGYKEWFFTLDLAPAFAAAAWQLLKGQRGLRFQQVQDRTRAAFESYLDSALLNKGIWEASSKTFTEAAVHRKVFAALQKANRLAFDAAMTKVDQGQELERVQYFLKRWINDSMARAWNSIPDAEKVLTERNVSRLFQNMLAPFGPDDPFSTIPSVFVEEIGPPPSDWSFVKNEVRHLFNSWSKDTAAKRRWALRAEQEQKRADVDGSAVHVPSHEADGSNADATEPSVESTQVALQFAVDAVAALASYIPFSLQ